MAAGIVVLSSGGESRRQCTPERRKTTEKIVFSTWSGGDSLE
jgi:hypothetical protein